MQDVRKIVVVCPDNFVKGCGTVDLLQQVEPGGLHDLEHEVRAEIVHHVAHLAPVEVAAVKDGLQLGEFFAPGVPAVSTKPAPCRVRERHELFPGGSQRPFYALQSPEHVKGDPVLGDGISMHLYTAHDEATDKY